MALGSHHHPTAAPSAEASATNPSTTPEDPFRLGLRRHRDRRRQRDRPRPIAARSRTWAAALDPRPPGGPVEPEMPVPRACRWSPPPPSQSPGASTAASSPAGTPRRLWPSAGAEGPQSARIPRDPATVCPLIASPPCRPVMSPAKIVSNHQLRRRNRGPGLHPDPDRGRLGIQGR